MPVISQEDIPIEIRKPHLDKRRKELKEALLSPALSEEQHLRVKQELNNLGKEKEYGSHIPFPIGAIKVNQ